MIDDCVYLRSGLNFTRISVARDLLSPSLSTRLILLQNLLPHDKSLVYDVEKDLAVVGARFGVSRFRFCIVTLDFRRI